MAAALETFNQTEFLNYMMYDSTISTTPYISNDCSALDPPPEFGGGGSSSSSLPPPPPPQPEPSQGRKKRRRRPKVCKNKEEAENQRMTHIAVERNRRKQMNEHLSVLRSLMPDSYVQRGDQASIVGGAIEFVKELEHILQSLEAKKFALQEQQCNASNIINNNNNSDQQQDNIINNNDNNNNNNNLQQPQQQLPFAQFFAYPQFSCSQNQLGNKFTSQTKAAIADIEVTLIETHANIRILSRKRVRQLSKLVASFQSVYLTILHLNLTTLDSLVLYSISAKVEEGCQLNSADDIAGAVHHMLRIIEEEAIILCSQS